MGDDNQRSEEVGSGIGSIFGIIGIAGVLTVGGALVCTGRSTAQPLEQRVQTAPVEPQVRELPPEKYEIGFKIVSRNGLAEKVGFHLSPRGQVYASDFAPLSYAIPGVLQGVQQFPFEQGATGATITFAKPQDLSGKTFILYGMHPVTRERVKLYERSFDEPQRAEEPKRWY